MAYLIVGCGIFAAMWTAICLNIVGRANWVDIVYGLAATLIILGAADLERTHRFRVPSILTFLGEASYSIYLVHFAGIAITLKILNVVTSHIQISPPFIFLLIAAGGLGTEIVFHLVAEKPILKRLPRSPVSSASAAAPSMAI
jgi:exopolysaccharide production protein ExoZ